MKKSLGFVLAVAIFAGIAAWPLPQGQGKKDQKQSDKKDDKGKTDDKNSEKKADDAPFGNKQINVVKSTQKTDSASMGFNGVGPDGQIDPAKLSENPTAADETLVTQIQQIAVAGDDLKEFIKDGSLKGR